MSFYDAVKIAEAFGFRLDRVNGSHHIFVHSLVPELLNLQNFNGQAKPYQIKQMLKLIETQTLKWRNKMNDYHINIFYNEDDQGYIADIPDLKSCSAFGNTPSEALVEVLVAKQSWLDAAKQNKKPIPEPAYKPVIYQVA